MNLENITADLVVLGLIALAMLLGAVIGYEREMASKPAGVRTHMLVAGAAALLVSLSEGLIGQTDSKVVGDVIRADPIRIVEAVITGVSFLGAGTIIHRGEGGGVKGLTTAASLLFTAGVGLAVALEELTLAVGGTVLVLATLRGVYILERRLASPLKAPDKNTTPEGNDK